MNLVGSEAVDLEFMAGSYLEDVVNGSGRLYEGRPLSDTEDEIDEEGEEGNEDDEKSRPHHELSSTDL
jgi:hypothetical protein